jgi:hypothetical protein
VGLALARKYNVNVTRDELAPLKQEDPMGLEQYADEIFKKGIEEGIEEGIKKGRREALLELLQGRFGEDLRGETLCADSDLERPAHPMAVRP